MWYKKKSTILKYWSDTDEILIFINIALHVELEDIWIVIQYLEIHKFLKAFSVKSKSCNNCQLSQKLKIAYFKICKVAILEGHNLIASGITYNVEN